LGELLSVISPEESLANHTVEDWMRDWVESKRGSTALATYSKYKQLTAAFLDYLGARRLSPLSAISRGDIARFRDGLRAQGYSARTANIAKGIISAPFALAVRQGILPFDPCGAVDNLRVRRADAAGREAFTLEEVTRLVALADGDWLGLILCCATTGLRISDAAALTWGDIDLEKRRLRVITRKTDTPIVLFLHDDFRSWLFGQSERGIGRAQVFPSLANVKTRGLRSALPKRMAKRGAAAAPNPLIACGIFLSPSWPIEASPPMCASSWRVIRIRRRMRDTRITTIKSGVTRFPGFPHSLVLKEAQA
jgi:integrase